MVPFGKGEIGIGEVKACDEVVFTSLDVTLSCIASVEMREVLVGKRQCDW